MEVTIYEVEVLINGVLIDIEAECSVVCVDDSFSHAFGVEKCGHWEVDEIQNVKLSDDLKALIQAELKNRGITKCNRRFKKRVRQLENTINRTLAGLDPDNVFSEATINAAIEEASSYETDYEDEDYSE